MSLTRTECAAKARAALYRKSAISAVSDPVKLDRSTRIVLAALEDPDSAKLEAAIERTLAQWPPLSSEQLDRLADLLRPHRATEGKSGGGQSAAA